jgi:hypothetical protein
MGVLFTVLCVIAGLALLLGLISPKLVIYWGAKEKKKRGRVLLYYGIAFVVCLVFAIVLTPTTPLTPEQKAAQLAAQQKQELADQAAKKQSDEAAAAKAKSDAEKAAADEAAKFDPLKQSWNTTELDASKNGNIAIAASVLTKYTKKKLVNTAISPSPSQAVKSPWKYYGKVVHVSGTADFMQDYAPGSDVSNNIADGKDAAELHLVTDDATFVAIFIIGTTGNIQRGETVNIYGFPVGTIENKNTLGGTVTELVLVGKN